jgi:hypothetical protein
VGGWVESVKCNVKKRGTPTFSEIYGTYSLSPGKGISPDVFSNRSPYLRVKYVLNYPYYGIWDPREGV